MCRIYTCNNTKFIIYNNIFYKINIKKISYINKELSVMIKSNFMKVYIYINTNIGWFDERLNSTLNNHFHIAL